MSIRIRKAVWWATLTGAFGLALLPLLFLGCKPKPATTAGTVGDSIAASAPIPPPPTRSISPMEVTLAMIATNITATSIAIPDAKYVMPTVGWIEREFSHGLFGFQHALGIATFENEAGDCDDFSQAAAFYAKWLNRVSPNRNTEAGLAVGELYYIKDSGGGHAINFIVTLIGDRIQIVFYEPQLRRIVSLSEAERGRVMFWKL